MSVKMKILEAIKKIRKFFCGATMLKVVPNFVLVETYFCSINFKAQSDGKDSGKETGLMLN